MMSKEKHKYTSNERPARQDNTFAFLVIAGLIVLAAAVFYAKKENPRAMVRVPSGEFIMGSDKMPDEKPPHKVYLNAYDIDKYEVTNAEYKECVEEGHCKEPMDKRFYDNKDYAWYPVVFVHWFMADNFCKWQGKRLPTEAEWEKAARGDSNFVYPWGNTWDASRSNNKGYTGRLTGKMLPMTGGRGVLPVGSLPEGASPYGAMDMAGNVWEWVNDWYHKNYYARSRSNNPRGISKGMIKSLRGGAFNGSADILRASTRGASLPDKWDMSIGFRCARSVQ